MNINTDITANRHKGAVTSVEAHERIKPVKKQRQQDVLFWVRFLQTTHLKEVARKMNKPANEISGRFSELLAAGQIEVVEGERREKCRVYRVKGATK